jgi:predicted nucleic acid-binding protein
MPLVVDCSVAAAWGLADEATTFTEGALRVIEQDAMIVPALFWFELRNLLIVAERRGRFLPTETSTFLNMMGNVPTIIDGSPNEAELMRLARSHRLTAYDAAYLEVAQRHQLPLCTLDRDLIAASTLAGVPLWALPKA